MSAPHNLLADLQSRGVEVIAEGQSLRCRAPRGVLSPGLLADLRSNKPEILAELSTPFARLERDWAAAWARAQDGFTVHGISPTHETLQAATVLELWIADGGPPRLGLTLEDLKGWTQEIYRGRGSARVSADGRVVLRALGNNDSNVGRWGGVSSDDF